MTMILVGLRRAVYGRACASAAALFGSLATVGFMAAPAMASAPNAIPGTTQVDSIITNSDGSHTVTVEGQWNWPTEPRCPTTRDGAGYQVDWFDGNTANPIGTANSPDGVLYVGDSTDNIVHSLDRLGGSNSRTNGDAFFNGVPSSYLTHNTTDSTPTTTDNQNWVSNCNNMNPSTLVSSGMWGPISHIYAPGVAWFTVCPVMYDPHGYGTSSGGAIGSSGFWALTAGGIAHNSDNSYDNGYRCLRSTFPIPPPSSSPSPTPKPTTTTPKPTTTTPTTTPISRGTDITKKNSRGAPLLRWTAVHGARYYNFQLYRHGKRILNIWPTHPNVRVSSSWRFYGRTYLLTPGRYRWYVWPGFGPPAAHRYGPAIGHTLVIPRLF
jgi:hypothetical protein